MTFEPLKTLILLVVGCGILLAPTTIQSLAQSTYEPYTFTILAGGGGFGTADQIRTTARLSNPQASRKGDPDQSRDDASREGGVSGTADGTKCVAQFYSFRKSVNEHQQPF